MQPAQANWLRAWLLVAIFLASPFRAAGADSQGWANLILGHFPAPKVYHELDIEAKILLSSGQTWRNIDATNLIEYYPNSWVDLTGEVTLGTTLQTDDLRSNELTFRAGIRTYFAKHLRSHLGRERIPLRRISFASLHRIERRTFWYSNDHPTETSYRARVRLEFKSGLNKADPTADGAWYAIADLEGYFDLGVAAGERFAQRARNRLGVGYMFDAKRRVDVLFILDRARDTIEATPTETLRAIDIRYRLTF
jgi:hypothetical protein